MLYDSTIFGFQVALTEQLIEKGLVDKDKLRQRIKEIKKRLHLADVTAGYEFIEDIVGELDKEEEKGKQVMPKIKGKPFRCECGCNVLTKVDVDKYQCNSCNALYQGE